MLSVSLDCTFCVCLPLMSCCIPNVVSVSGLYSLCLSSSYVLLYTQCCQCLWIVHSVFVFLLCLVVYPMLSVSLDCTFCVCLPLMSCCIPNVVSVSGLYILCLSSSYVLLYTQCCQCLWIVHSVFVFLLCLVVYPMLLVSLDCTFCVCLPLMSCCIPNVVSVSGLYILCLSSSYVLLYTQCCQCLWIVHSVFVFLLCLVVYPMLSVSLDCTFCVCLPLMSCCIPNVVSVSGLYILCLSSSYVWLYTQCCQCLWIVHSVFVFLLCLVVYPMLSVSLDCTFCVCLPLMSCCIPNVVSVSGLYILCLSSSFVLLYTQCCWCLWIVHSVFVFLLCLVVYPMLSVSLDCTFCVCLPLMSCCIPNVVGVSGLYILCLSSSYVLLYTQCC